MINETKKRELINELNLIADRIESDWPKFNEVKLNELKMAKEVLWQALLSPVLERRTGKDRRAS